MASSPLNPHVEGAIPSFRARFASRLRDAALRAGAPAAAALCLFRYVGLVGAIPYRAIRRDDLSPWAVHGPGQFEGIVTPT